MKKLLLPSVMIFLLLSPGVAGDDDVRPDDITIHHIVIGFKKSLEERAVIRDGFKGYASLQTGDPSHWRPAVEKNIPRTRKEARRFAGELLARAEAGEDFDSLQERFSDDDSPGVMRILNTHPRPGEGPTGHYAYEGNYARNLLPMRFSDVAFNLEVGEVGLVKYSSSLSPYGWHIIKRLK